jgi:hypothetical protein
MERKVMRLKKAMYGTRQAARCWFLFFKEKMENIGFTASELEPSVFFCRRGNDFLVIWLHVDNGFAVGSSRDILDQLRSAMSLEMEFGSRQDCRNQLEERWRNTFAGSTHASESNNRWVIMVLLSQKKHAPGRCTGNQHWSGS